MSLSKKLNKAMKAQRGGQLEIATRLYRQILKADPGYVEAHTCLGSALFAQGKADAALASLRRAVELAPGYADGHNSLGAALTMLGSLDDAQKSFERTLELEPDHAGALANLGDLLSAKTMYREAVERYERALAIDPQNMRAVNNLGAAFLSMGLKEQAIDCYERALEIDPSNAYARENLTALTAGQIPSWHFDMLADDMRNRAYEEAIERAVTPQSRVLDIGTGSGLLSMMAARAGAAHVTTCEVSTPIANAAKEIIEANGYADRITVINKMSTQLVVGADLPARATLLISEIVDNKVIGEGVLPTLRHAVEKLLEPGGTMIPVRARIKAMLVEAPERRKTHPLRQVCGFDLSPFERFRDPNRFVSIQIEHEALRPLSDVVTALSFDFTKPPAQASEPNRTSLKIQASTEGLVQAVAFWLELDIDDELTVSAGTGGALNHWRQNLHVLPGDIPVKPGERLRLDIAQSDQTLKFSVRRDPGMR